MAQDPAGPWTYSQVESRRFGLRVFRGEVSGVDAKAILSFALDQRADLLILRLPASRQHQIARLDNTGLPYLAAGTLATYSCDLRQYSPLPLRNASLAWVPCGPGQAACLGQMIGDVFADYPNHYLSNPMIDPALVLEGYREWAIAGLGRDGCPCFLAVDKETPVGFAAWSSGQGECAAVLNGVAPKARGRGVYTDLIRYGQRWFKDRSVERMSVSTQVHNQAVQRALVHEGFVLDGCLVTVHVNAMLDKCLAQKTIIPIRLENQEKEFSLEFSQAFSRAYAKRFSTSEVRVVRQSLAFLRPLAKAQDLALHVGEPVFWPFQGVYKAVALLMDGREKIFAVACMDFGKNGDAPAQGA